MNRIFSEEERRDMRQAADAIGIGVELFPPFRGRDAILAANRASRARVIGTETRDHQWPPGNGAPRYETPLERATARALAEPGAKWTPETGWTDEPLAPLPGDGYADGGTPYTDAELGA